MLEFIVGVMVGTTVTILAIAIVSCGGGNDDE